MVACIIQYDREGDQQHDTISLTAYGHTVLLRAMVYESDSGRILCETKSDEPFSKIPD